MKFRANQVFDQQNVMLENRVIATKLDLRYHGQEHYLSIDYLSNDLASTIEGKFQIAHKERHGHSMDEKCEIVSVRVKCFAQVQKPELPKLKKATEKAQSVGTRQAYDFSLEKVTLFKIYDRNLLEYGMKFKGPAVIQEDASATIVFSDQIVEVDEYGQLLISKLGGNNE